MMDVNVILGEFARLYMEKTFYINEAADRNKFLLK